MVGSNPKAGNIPVMTFGDDLFNRNHASRACGESEDRYFSSALV